VRNIYVLALSVLANCSIAAAAPRTRLCLNGWWRFQPVERVRESAPADWDGPDQRILVPSEWTVIHSEWNAYDVFGYPQAWRRAQHGWYRRTFRPTEAMAGKRLWLRFDAVSFRAQVYVNGQRVGSHDGSFTPLRFDITDIVRMERDNTLLVAVSAPSIAWQDGKFVWPMGSWWGWHQAGIWQDVWLEALPPVRAEQVFVSTSVRESIINVEQTIVNDTNADQSIRVTAQPTAVRGGGRGPRMISDPFTLSPGERGSLLMTAPWRNPHLWSPEDPFLYHLEVMVERRDGRRWRMIDRSDTRFGFREFWIDGQRFVLNGVPINLRGDSWHYFGSTMQTRGYVETWYRMAKSAGINIIRPHAMPYPPVFYDVADEVGMLIVDESPVYGSGGNIATDRPEFWEHSRQAVRDWVLRDRNHPSVVLWSASNEILWGGRAGARDDLFSLQALIHALDPTRPVYFEGEGDLEGLADIYGLHYPHGLGGHWLLPDAAYEYVDDRGSVTHRGKPAYIGEYGGMYHATPDQMCPLGGDETYAEFDGLLRSHAAEVEFRQVAYRQGGVDGITPWNTVWYSLYPLPFADVCQSYPDMTAPGAKPLVIHKYACTLNPGYDKRLPQWRPNPVYRAIAWANRPVAAFVRERDHNFFAGDAVTRTVTVFNDTTTAARFRLRWETRTGNRTVEAGEKRLFIGRARHRTFTVTLHMPDVAEKTGLRWTRSLYREEKLVNTETTEYFVYPTSLATDPLDLGGTRVYLYDTVGRTREILDGLGVRYESIDAPSVQVSSDSVVVAGAGTSPPREWREEFAALTRRRCTIVAFEQDSELDWLPTRIHLSSRAATVTFPQAPGNPMLDGLLPDDLRYWRGGHIVARQLFHRPRVGSALSLIDAGSEAGLQWTPLIELRQHQGRYLLCQLALTDKFGTDPIATMLLRRLLEYAATTQPRAATAKRLSDGDGALAQALDRVGLRERGVVVGVGKTPPAADVLMVDGADARMIGFVPAFSREKTCVLILGPTPATAAALSHLLGCEVRIVPHPAAHLRKAHADPLLTGINNHDLYWVGRGKRKIMDHAIDLSAAADAEPLIVTSSADWDRFRSWPEQTKYAGQMLARDEYQPACAMARFRIEGEREIILCTLNLAQWIEEPKAQRILSALLTNLGVTLEVDAEIDREIPPQDWTATASHASGAAALAFDRSHSTRWTTMEAQAPGMWFRLDLGRVETFDRIALDTVASPNDYPRAFAVETSMDGDKWTVLVSRDRVEGDPDPPLLDLRLPPTTARHLRITQSGSTPNWWWSIYEVYLYRPRARE